MRNLCFQLASILFLLPAFSNGQKLKKADRTIVSNIQNHISFLKNPKLESRKSGTAGEQLADDYIRKQLEKQGVKPAAANSSWYQKFNISDGRAVLPTSFFVID